jgi:hypothetical protein
MKRENIDIERHIEARTKFASLVLKDADYFKTKLAIEGNTGFEEVTCVGLNPQQHALYATVSIKQDTGYGGDLCDGPGGREYVRFFADWDGDGDFDEPDEDLGVASIAVHDIPGLKPLEYVVALSVTEQQQFCFFAGPVAVRAVLMYNQVPPAGDANPYIVWGNTLDATVQPETKKFTFVDIFDELKVELPLSLANAVDLDAPVGKPKMLQPVEVVEHYETLKADVPLHRQLAPQLAQVIKTMTFDAGAAQPQAFTAKLESLLGQKLIEKIDLGDIIGTFVDLDGNTTYEEVHCVGLHQDLSGVAAVLDVKQSTGYSGGLCTAGSVEYVAFWADWDNSGSFDQYLGTAVVRVHDEPIPAGGIQYAVFLPVNLAPHRRPCHESPVAKIRAVLSWNTPPSVTNPWAVPTWGNITDALVQLPTGDPVVGQVPFVSVVGGMAVTDIDSAGYATGTAVMAGFHADQSPFAREVSIAGHISNPPDLSAGQAPLTYGLRYRHESEVGFHEITNTFQVTLSEYSGGAWTQTHDNQVADPVSHRYQYREDLSPNGPSGDLTYVEGFVLGKWQTLGLSDGRYEVWMVADIGGTTVESNHVWVRLDNTSPVAALTLAGDPFTPQGTPVTGTFQATDDHLGGWSLGVLPGGYPHAVSPAGGAWQAAAGTPFSLSTAGVTPGGYVLHLAVRDRSIVNSGSIGLWATDDVGFCVEDH